MSGHTATPWKVCRNDSGELCIGTNENEPWYIAEMCLGAGGHDVDEPAETNAAFIVTACNSHAELVKALEEILSAEQEFREGMPDGWEGDPLTDACATARAALATLTARKVG